MLQSRSTIHVRYAETDMMGIVYHGSYLPWLEVARTTLLKEQGFPYRELEIAGYRLPVLAIAVKYLRPAAYDDDVDILVFIHEPPALRIRIDYKVMRGDDLLATAQSEHAFVDLQGQPTRPPANFVQAMRDRFPT